MPRLFSGAEMTTRTIKWPAVESHDKAFCFDCGADLDGSYPHDSGNADGNGRWQQHCPKCDLITWYDLKVSSDRSEARRRHSAH
jgi:hypothetical protein